MKNFNEIIKKHSKKEENIWIEKMYEKIPEILIENFSIYMTNSFRDFDKITLKEDIYDGINLMLEYEYYSLKLFLETSTSICYLEYSFKNANICYKLIYTEEELYINFKYIKINDTEIYLYGIDNYCIEDGFVATNEESIIKLIINNKLKEISGENYTDLQNICMIHSEELKIDIELLNIFKENI